MVNVLVAMKTSVKSDEECLWPVLSTNTFLSKLSSERDMFDHRNQQFSTILVAATIMLAALVAVLAQGVLHEDSQKNSILVIAYAASNSLSMSFLFTCDIFCMGVLWRASQFMKNRSRDHCGYLHRAIRKTKKMVKSIRGVKSDSVRNESHSNEGVKNHDSDSDSRVKNTCRRSSSQRGSHICKKRRIISHMGGSAVDKEFNTHEAEVHRYLEEREKIIDKSAYVVSGAHESDMRSFESFWQDSCSFYANMAVLMFYAGSGSLVVANGTFVSSTFWFRYRSYRGGAITFVVIFFTIPLAICLLIYMRYIEFIPMESPLSDAHKTINANVNDHNHNQQQLHQQQQRQQSFELIKIFRYMLLPWERIRMMWKRYTQNYTEIPPSDDGDSSYEHSSSSGLTGQSLSQSHTDVSSLRSISSHSAEVEVEVELVPMSNY